MRLAASIFALAIALSAEGCRPEVRLCRPASGDCGSGNACVAGRCAPTDLGATPPAAVVGERALLAPIAMRVVGAPPSTSVELGGRGAEGILFAFPALPAGAEVVEAFLLVPRDPDAPPTDGVTSLAGDVPTEPWIGLERSRPAPRLLGLDGPTTLAGPTGGRAIRVDVAAALRRATVPGEIFLAARTSGRRGVAVLADLFGDAVTSPRLDVYYRTKKNSSASSAEPVKSAAPASSNAGSAAFVPY